MVKIATTVYTTEEVTLQDGTTVTLKPLNIKNQRRFMAEWNKMLEVINEAMEKKEQIDEAATTDLYVTCAGICLERELKKEVEAGEEEYREYLEENLDMPTIFKILEVCAGMKMNDENLMRAAERVAAGTA